MQPDGTCDSLTVKKNYESYAQKLKDRAKENPDHGKDAKKSKGHKKRLFAYSFALMDLQTRLYIAFGSSMKSEREAYDRAMDLLSSIGIGMDSIRLDRYHSSPSYMGKLGDTKVFVIPKKNATLNGSKKWKDSMRDFVENTCHTWNSIIREAIPNQDLQQTGRCLVGMWLRRGMTG